MKVCSKCKVEKDLSDFGIRNRKRKDGSGYTTPISVCKVCKYEQTNEWRSKNKEHLKESRKTYYANNKDKEIAGMIRWRSENAAHVKSYSKKYNESHRAERTALQNKRHAKKVSASILEGDELNDFIISEIYKLRAIRSEETNIVWHVDHVIPLQGKEISGLHVWYNLSCIPAKLNLLKRNKVL